MGGTDTVFVGEWVPTETILEAMIGEENNVDPVTEQQARDCYPEAFATS